MHRRESSGQTPYDPLKLASNVHVIPAHSRAGLKMALTLECGTRKCASFIILFNHFSLALPRGQVSRATIPVHA